MTSTAFPTAEHAELIRSLAAFCERPGPGTAHIASALGLSTSTAIDHTELFVQQMPPYASIYLDAAGKIGGEAQDRIAGFWRAMHMIPPAEPDHLAAMLGLWAAIVEKTTAETQPERRSLLDHSAQTLVWEHLVPWLTPFLARVGELSASFAAWSGLLGAAIQGALSHSASSELPAHLTMARPGLAGHDDLVPFVLAPIRSGILLTRADLHRAAADLGLGVRIGERAFGLRSLLEQDRGPVVDWIADEATRQAQLFSSEPIAATVGAVWSDRAERARISLLAHRGP